jgi:hypothetical protein
VCDMTDLHNEDKKNHKVTKYLTKVIWNRI